MPYLCEKFGKTDALYPKDIKKRAIIHQRLHFNGGIFFPRITAALVSGQTLQIDDDRVTIDYLFIPVETHNFPW